MLAAVATTVTAPEMIRSGKNHPAPVEKEISGLEPKQAGRYARLLAPTVAAGTGVDAKRAVVSSAAQRTILSGSVHGNCACTR